MVPVVGQFAGLFRDSHFFIKYVPNIWQCIDLNIYFHEDNHIDTVGSVIFVEIITRQNGTITNM